VLEERKDEAANAETQYVWDARYIDAPVLRWHDANGDGDADDTHETLYYTADANMNVTALVDTSGTVLERVVYDPYGNPTFYDGSWTTASDTSSYDNVVLYCGYRWDGETGLYHVRHRVYHATLARWVQRDPAGYVDGMGLYEYAGSNSIRSTDPSGKVKVKWEETPDPQSMPIRTVPKATLDAMAPDRRAGTIHGMARVDFERPFMYTALLINPGGKNCCLCWYHSATVRIVYDAAIRDDLSDKNKERAELHERAHLVQDFSDVFNTELYRVAANVEVALHDTQEEAYRLDAKTLQECEATCRTTLAEHWARATDESIRMMRMVMSRRAAARDWNDYMGLNAARYLDQLRGGFPHPGCFE